MARDDGGRPSSAIGRLLWFVALWGAGVAAVAAVGWLIRLAIG